MPHFKEKHGVTNVMAIPKVTKVILNMGLGQAIQNSKLLDSGVEELTAIAGQKAVVTRAKKSIAAFKLREGMAIGCRVTLRGARMYEFLDRLFNVAMPRVRDFRGVKPNGFDGRGNFSLGVTEHTMFPEIEYDKVDQIKGLSIAIVTTATSDAMGKELLTQLGMPFRA